MSKNFTMGLKSESIKALLTAGVAGVGSYMFLGESQNVDIPVIGAVSSGLVVGAAAGAGSLISDMFSDNVLKMIPQSAKMKNFEATAVKLGLSGAATAGVLKVVVGIPNDRLPYAFGIGAASKIAADWTYNNVVDAKRSGFLIG